MFWIANYVNLEQDLLVVPLSYHNISEAEEQDEAL
jgi:hypothetical protein